MNLSSFFPAPALINGARTTVLNTLAWMAVLLMTGLIGSAVVKAPEWLLVMLAVLFALDFVVFILAYIYFARTNPEMLRSEHFAIKKLEIEHRIYGDNTTGPMEGEVIDDVPMLGAPAKLIGSQTTRSTKKSKGLP
jgi:hypothetical protein